ncbi:protein YLS7-like isoform X1 [Cynara cardunculus var. scolymus]|uniref:protein YLS7-like isoform X1 n=1 Tax=Cynara cardunculus var. scolymus TaxID=59895 RepID=UPI000D62A2C3|nr:protein YLS7-like isoform X1 [Cynara cardunculus var. scolymus]XP_024990877.1 protein YLS7-like isoform X1 [Cynara cardunculus var. scolymus]
MRSGSPKSMTPYPKVLLPFAASVGGLALFLIFACLLLIYQPIGSKFGGYFYNPDQASEIGLSPSNNEISVFRIPLNNTETKGRIVDPGTNGTVDSGNNWTIDLGTNRTVDLGTNTTVGSDTNTTVGSDTNTTFDSGTNTTVDSGTNTTVDSGTNTTVDSGTNTTVDSGNNTTFDSGTDTTVDIGTNMTVDSGCDLYNGKWVYDSGGPLYSNNSCPVLTQMQNCQGNGRPDQEYENWRWKPTQCDLPRFDPKKFLELMRGKTLAFIGDSVARNQMESMLCILWQVEAPTNRGNKRMQRYYFRSTSTMIIRIWSSWLVHKTNEKFDFAPEGVDKLHLDAPDETFMDIIPSVDVLVLSSGHWFAKKSVYILNNEIVGGQLWWPDNTRKKKIDSTEAFEISVATIISSLVTNPNYKGLTVVRSYSPDHYEGGAWNTGGSCTGKVKPAVDGELVESWFTNTMHDKQVSGFNRGIKNKTNKSRVKFMDITKPFSYRHDGHPGPYRSLDPNKITKRSADGRPPPQDCLHWCMPGPVDTWNEFLLEIIRRDFGGEGS